MVDHERTYRRIVGYLKRTSPELAARVERYSGKEPLLEKSGVARPSTRRSAAGSTCPSGGYLIFDYAEAFTVIDVNTGRFVGGRGKSSQGRLEDTITKNNLEAVGEVVRQLRLRDIGGIIVIDFIDMANPKNRQLVEEALNRELARDRTKTYVVEISPLGLVEMTRQNVTDGPREILTIACPTCAGDGVIVSPETHAVEAERKLRQHIAGSKAEAFVVEMHSDVAAILIGPGGSRLAELEQETGRRFAFKTKKSFRLDRFQVLSEGKASEIEGLAPKIEEKPKARPRRGAKAPVTPIVLEDEFVDDGEPEEPAPKPKARPSRAKAPVAPSVADDEAEATPTDDGRGGSSRAEAEEEDPPRDAWGPGSQAQADRGGRGQRRRLDRRARRRDERPAGPAELPPEPAEEPATVAEESSGKAAEGDGEPEKPKKKTRRGTRGGRRRKKKPPRRSKARRRPPRATPPSRLRLPRRLARLSSEAGACPLVSCSGASYDLRRHLDREQAVPRAGRPAPACRPLAPRRGQDVPSRPRHARRGRRREARRRPQGPAGDGQGRGARPRQEDHHRQAQAAHRLQAPERVPCAPDAHRGPVDRQLALDRGEEGAGQGRGEDRRKAPAAKKPAARKPAARKPAASTEKKAPARRSTPRKKSEDS